jgi:LmbE family N-acetylglucosaminyl deacetylase
VGTGMSDPEFESRLFYRCILNRVTNILNEEALKQTAIVFSPHPDDETLCCGGTIIKKRMAGAKIKIFFMTDGRRSQSHLISEEELKVIRKNEALAASRMLGLKATDTSFLEYKDGELNKNQISAIRDVVTILKRQQPDEIFIPHRRETHPDHSATYEIVMSALRTRPEKTMIYEYPTWLWNDLPWISMPIVRTRITPQNATGTFKNSLLSSLSFLKDFRCSSYIGDVLPLKLSALDQYKSQMTRLIPDTRWPTIGDVSDGEFLKCFIQEYEIFHQHIFQR